MRQNPIALIEFVAFIGLVIWLFVWQYKPSRSDRSQRGPTEDQAESGESPAASPGEARSRPPSGEA
jgi:hypothetical protein